MPPCAERPEQVAQRARVLGGEHLGGREQRGLAAGVDHLQHRPQRHDRLARAHVSLEQPQHRHVARKVRGDLLAHRPLAGGERERQPRVERVDQSRRASPGALRRRAPRAPPCAAPAPSASTSASS